MPIYTDEQMRQVLAQYGPTVYRLALAQLRNRCDAEDVYQEVFLKLLRYPGVFEDAEHQKAWLLRVTVNCCKDCLKKASRREVSLTDREFSSSPAEENEVLSLALESLPEQQRAIIHLHYYEGYTTKEIAFILGMNHSTVRSALRRACQKLQKFMEGVEF